MAEKTAIDSQHSLKIHVEGLLNQYLETLGGHRPTNLYQFVLDEVEEPLIRTVLRYSKNNQTQAARILGLSRGTLRKKMKQCGML